MTSIHTASTPIEASTSPKTDPRLLEALASLNQIGTTINRIGPGDVSGNAGISVEATLNLIVESAIRVVPGASAVIYTYDEIQGGFDPTSRVSAGEREYPTLGDEPRPNGLGMRATSQRRRVLSYEEPDLSIHPLKITAGVKAVSCSPLIVAEQAVGALYVDLHENRYFSQLELLMLDNFVNQAAMAIYHTHRLVSIQRDLARKEDELIRLRRAGLLISSRLRLEDTLEAILQMALEVTDAQYGIFRLLDKGGQNLITRAIAGERLARPLVEALPCDSNSVMSWVARHRQAVCIPDLRAEPWSHIYYPLDKDLEMRSELAVPIISTSGRLEGVLNLESPRVGSFDEEDSHLLQALATMAVTAIQEARLLDALQEVAQLLLSQPYEHVLLRLSELACDLLYAAGSAIWLLKGEDLVLEVTSGSFQHDERIPLHNSLTGLAVLERKPVISGDVQIDTRFNRPDLAHAQNWERALIVPLLTGDDDKPIGAISVYSAKSDPGRFVESEWDEKVLACLARYAVLSVQNAARQDALRAAQEQRAIAETFAAVGDIASNLLHQLNNKVGTIPVRIQGIQDKCRPALSSDTYLTQNLAEIERCASEAMETVRENLSHLRPIRLEAVNVADCVNDAIQGADLPSSVQVHIQTLTNLPVVMGGHRSLTLVFSNLLENATDAMRGEGDITIQGEVSNGWVEIAVSDSGPGIAPELHDRIFELNFSGRSASRPGKLGFGLWWVKTAMTRLGGTVAVKSDGQHGATFLLKLPCATPLCPPIHAPMPSKEKTSTLEGKNGMMKGGG